MIITSRILVCLRDFKYRRNAYFAWNVFKQLYKTERFKKSWNNLNEKVNPSNIKTIHQKLQNVEFYMEDGVCDIEKLIQEVNDADIQTRLFFELSRANESDNSARSPYTSHVKDGIFNLSICQNKIVLFFFCWGPIIVVTNGCIETTHEKNTVQLQIAKDRRNQHLNRIYGEYDEW